jgi:hypothetical protein
VVRNLMAKVFSLALPVLGALSARAVEIDGLMLDAELKVQTGAGVSETHSRAIIGMNAVNASSPTNPVNASNPMANSNTTSNSSANSSNWVELSRTKDRTVLYGRRTGGDSDVMELEFKLVDRSKTPERTVAMMLRTRLGQKAEFSSQNGDGENVTFTVVATRVRYQLDQN